MGDKRPDFSFSGLKTAVQKYVRESGLQPVSNGGEPSQGIKDLAASFQNTVVRSLVSTMERVAQEYRPKTLIVAGGVACNGALRDASRKAADKLGVPIYFPSPHLSTDNAAMIAAAGTVKLEAGERAGWDLNADVMLRLQNIEVKMRSWKASSVSLVCTTSCSLSKTSTGGAVVHHAIKARS